MVSIHGEDYEAMRCVQESPWMPFAQVVTILSSRLCHTKAQGFCNTELGSVSISRGSYSSGSS